MPTIKAILDAQLAEAHPLKSNSNGMPAFARLVPRLEACQYNELNEYIAMIEERLENFAGCNCYIKMHLFLSIFCASHLGMSNKAKNYFNAAKIRQQAEINRGGNRDYFREVYNAVVEYGINNEKSLEEWPLCEMNSIEFRPISKTKAIQYKTVIKMLGSVMDEITVNNIMNLKKSKIDIIDNKSGKIVGKIEFNLK